MMKWYIIYDHICPEDDYFTVYDEVAHFTSLDQAKLWIATHKPPEYTYVRLVCNPTEFLMEKRKQYPEANCIECKIDDCCTNCDIGTEIDEWIEKLEGEKQ